MSLLREVSSNFINGSQEITTRLLVAKQCNVTNLSVDQVDVDQVDVNQLNVNQADVQNLVVDTVLSQGVLTVKSPGSILLQNDTLGIENAVSAESLEISQNLAKATLNLTALEITDNSPALAGDVNAANLTAYGLSTSQLDTTSFPPVTFNSAATVNPTTMGILAENQTAGSNAVVGFVALAATGQVFVQYESNSNFQDFLYFTYNGNEVFRYNATSITLASGKYLTGAILLPTTTGTATTLGTTLTVAGSAILSFRNFQIGYAGTTSAINTLNVVNMPLNAIYDVAIYNGGSGNLVINTGLGANVRTTYAAPVNVASGARAVLTIKSLAFTNGGTIYVVSATVLT